jgi:hypothetical protein
MQSALLSGTYVFAARYAEIFSAPRISAIAPGNNFCMFRLNEPYAFFLCNASSHES